MTRTSGKWITDKHQDSGTKLATDPTPEEIEQRSAEIRATWNERKRLNRLGIPYEERYMTVQTVEDCFHFEPQDIPWIT